MSRWCWCWVVRAHKSKILSCVVINFSRPVNRQVWRGRASLHLWKAGAINAKSESSGVKWDDLCHILEMDQVSDHVTIVRNSLAGYLEFIVYHLTSLAHDS